MKRVFIAAALLAIAGASSAQITVMNVVPAGRSAETAQDAECSIAVNPADPQQIAASAFTCDNLVSCPSMIGSLAPVYLTTDGGTTWTAPLIIPSTAGSFPTYDITLHFTTAPSGTASNLYATILHTPDQNLRTYRGASPTFTMSQIDSDTDVHLDQPHVDAALTSLFGDAGNDHLYVGFNNGYGGSSATGKTATVNWSLNGNVASPAFTRTVVEARATTGAGGQDGFSIVPAAHPDGTVYAAFYGWRGAAGNPTDVVVVRDDNHGSAGFASLLSGGVAGVQVVTGAVQAFGNMGNQRLGASNIALAVDPHSSDRLYLAWGDQPAMTSNQTIHVRMSTTRGVSWSGDLLTIPNAVSPALAINSRGRVALLYQQFTSSRWQTILRRTTDIAGLVFDPGTTLANTATDAPKNYDPYLGDYTHMVANGHDFYGAFAASNTPDMANFPSGVTYQRYANFTTHQLFADAAMTTPVGVSIDPFVFHSVELSPSSDLYVRDWTDSASSGDNGAEPSSHAAFYVTPDVWNRRGTLTGEPFPNDQPTNEPAGNGTGNIGDNWAFARIRRNASATSETVTAHFVVSPFGTGSNFSDASMPFPGLNMSAPDPAPIAFPVGDAGPHITDPYPWHLDSIASTHLCLGVQIDSANDHYLAPGLAGHAPGWGSGTDLEILEDNNKAQRNMGLSTTPARGVGGTPSVGAWALIHNAATFLRDMQLRYDADPRVIDRFGGKVEIRTGDGERIPFRSGNTITLAKMQPGENRWIRIALPVVKTERGEILPVRFYELRDGKVVNGFAVGIQGGSDEDVIRVARLNHAATMQRIAKLYGSRAAANEMTVMAPNAMARVLAFPNRARSLAKVLVDLDKAAGNQDAFGAREALLTLQQAREPLATAIADTTLMNALDARTTSIELAKGNPADILQTVAWQRRLFQSLPLGRSACAARIVTASAEFDDAIASRKEKANRIYPRLLESVSGCLAEAGKQFGVDLAPDLSQISRVQSDLAALQKAHRDMLLRLSAVRPSPDAISNVGSR